MRKQPLRHEQDSLRTIRPVTTQTMDAKKLIPAAVTRASQWALVTACVTAFSVATGVCFALLDPCSKSSLLSALEPVANSQGIGMLCCVALQAAVAVLALCLPCSRPWVRRTLAYLALTLAIVGHCFLAALVRLFLVADPGEVFIGISLGGYIFLLALGDIICFLALLLGGEKLGTQ